MESRKASSDWNALGGTLDADGFLSVDPRFDGNALGGTLDADGFLSVDPRFDGNALVGTLDADGLLPVGRPTFDVNALVLGTLDADGLLPVCPTWDGDVQKKLSKQVN
jgi:hypothetical protein